MASVCFAVLFSEHAWLTWTSTITSHALVLESDQAVRPFIQFNSSKVPTLAVGTTQNLRVPPAVTCRKEGKLGHPNEVGVQFSLVKWHWLLRVIKR